MTHYIVRTPDDLYLTPRRATNVMYENRSGWEPGIHNARVFNTHAAASRSANDAAARGEEYEITPVFLAVADRPSTVKLKDGSTTTIPVGKRRNLAR